MVLFVFFQLSWSNKSVLFVLKIQIGRTQDFDYEETVRPSHQAEQTSAKLVQIQD